MTFSSIAFFVFFTVVCTLMAVTNIAAFSNRKLRHCVLLIASYIFYGWWDWRFCFLMFVLILVAYSSALQIGKHPHNKRYMISGVAVPLVILGIFKYFNFFVASFAELFSIRHVNALHIILPVGISFYTFQSLSVPVVCDVFLRPIWLYIMEYSQKNGIMIPVY